MISTFYTKDELYSYKSVTDPELNELFQEIRSLESNYYLKEMTFQSRKKFMRKKSPDITRYELLYDCGCGECQIINFNQDHEGSINTWVSKSYIMTLFLGWLNGYKRGNQNNK